MPEYDIVVAAPADQSLILAELLSLHHDMAAHVCEEYQDHPARIVSASDSYDGIVPQLYYFRGILEVPFLRTGKNVAAVETACVSIVEPAVLPDKNAMVSGDEAIAYDNVVALFTSPERNDVFAKSV